MKNTSLLHIGLPQQFSEAIFLGVNCKINLTVFDLQPQQPTQYLTQTQVAQLFNVDIKSIRNWTRKNKLKAYKYGYRIFFKRHELINAIIH